MSSLHTVPSQAKYGLIKKSGAAASSMAPRASAAPAPVKRTHLSAFDLDDDDEEDDDGGSGNNSSTSRGKKEGSKSSSGRADISRVNQALYSRPSTPPAAATGNSTSDDAALNSAFDYDGAYDSFKAETAAKSHTLSQSAGSGAPVRLLHIRIRIFTSSVY
jgi:hypothetical protein